MREVQVKDVVEIINGFAFDSNLFNNRGMGLPIARIRDVIRGYSETFYSGEYSNDYIIDNGAILVGMDGEFNIAVWKGGRALLNQRVCRILPKPGFVNETYIRMRLSVLLKKIEENTPYVTVKHLSSEKLKKERLILPPLSEQQHIAAILDKADRLRRLRRYAIELGDSYLESAFLEMFGDFKNADIVTIQKLMNDGTIIKMQDGNHGGDYPRSSEFIPQGIPFLTATNIVNGQVKLNEAPCLRPVRADKLRIGWVQPSDVLLAHNATVGRVAIMPSFKGKVVLGTSLTYYRLNTKRLLPEFLSEVFRSQFFQGQLEKFMKQTTRNQVPITRQRTLFVPVPPDIDEQEKFARVVQRYERLRSQQQEALRQAELLFQSLLYRAFEDRL